MQTETRKQHRLSAFVNGFLSGLGLLLIIWGLISVVSFNPRNATVYIGLILFGVLMFVSGGLREAYTWGKFSAQPNLYEKAPLTRTRPLKPSRDTGQPQQTQATSEALHQKPTTPPQVTTEQIIDPEAQAHEAVVCEQEKQTPT